MSFKTKFSNLGHPNRIWTVSAINGELGRLKSLHAKIFSGFSPGDRLVYTGNYFCGRNSTASPLDTMTELLHFRRALLAETGVLPGDFVYLRGVQEELWNKILQIQFAPSARDMIDWLQKKYPEMDQMLRAYGSSLDEAGRLAREGIMSLTRWTGFLKNNMRQHDGHDKFFTVLRRAAFTELRNSNDNLLFVHAGFNPALPLVSQGDHFWWAPAGFNALSTPYSPFRAVIRGFDPEQQGVHIGTATISLDGGAGHGGQLVCAQLSGQGDVMELIAA